MNFLDLINNVYTQSTSGTETPTILTYLLIAWTFVKEILPIILFFIVVSINIKLKNIANNIYTIGTKIVKEEE